MIEETSPEVPSKALVRYIVGRSLEPGTLYSFEELEHELGLVWQQLRSCVRWSNRITERKHQRTLAWVQETGIRVMHPKEFPTAIRGRMVKAQNQVEAATHTVKHTDTALLSPQERVELGQRTSATVALARLLNQQRRSLDGFDDESEGAQQ